MLCSNSSCPRGGASAAGADATAQHRAAAGGGAIPLGLGCRQEPLRLRLPPLGHQAAAPGQRQGTQPPVPMDSCCCSSAALAECWRTLKPGSGLSRLHWVRPFVRSMQKPLATWPPAALGPCRLLCGGFHEARGAGGRADAGAAVHGVGGGAVRGAVGAGRPVCCPAAGWPQQAAPAAAAARACHSACQPPGRRPEALLTAGPGATTGCCIIEL